MTPIAVLQTTVILGCLFIIARSSKGSGAGSRAWARHPYTIRALAQERGSDTEEAFVWKLGYAGIDVAIARALWSEIQLLVGLHYGVKRFPVRPDDELRRTYLFSLELYTGYPDDPDLLGSAWALADAAKRRFPKDRDLVEQQLAQLRTVMDLARWVHELPSIESTAE